MSLIQYPIRYNGTQLNSLNGITVLRTDPYKMPKRNLSMSKLARTSRTKLNSSDFDERLITVKVAVQGNSRAEMEQNNDDLMALLQPVNKELILNQSGAERLYYCSLQDAEVSEDNGSYMEIDLVFSCTDQYGYDVTATTLLNISSAHTTSSRTDQLTFGGSAKTQAPIITLTYSSITGGTNKTVSIGNADTAQLLEITRTWSNGDVLVIDTSSQVPKVTVNNVSVDFTGGIPDFVVGNSNWTYEDNFTARSFTGSITCKFRYS